jgi:N-acetylglucosamine-6-phosphate deacetylase
LLPRHENILWEQLAHDGLVASIISDGHHLPPSVVKAFVRAKRDRLILTCDAGSLAGLPPGTYHEWGTELAVLPGGKIVVPGTPFLAGSGLLLDACVAHLLAVSDVTIKDAFEMASLRGRSLFGLPVPNVMVGSTEFVLVDPPPPGARDLARPSQ